MFNLATRIQARPNHGLRLLKVERHGQQQQAAGLQHAHELAHCSAVISNVFEHIKTQYCGLRRVRKTESGNVFVAKLADAPTK